MQSGMLNGADSGKLQEFFKVLSVGYFLATAIRAQYALLLGKKLGRGGRILLPD